MTSTVLARKYRPLHFEAMVGQGHVVQALGNALQQQRLHHAYLFTGTRGVGKTTVSRILAKSLNCVGPDGSGGITSRPCGQCQPCRDIDAGRFVDYVEMDAASNRGVDEISQLLDQAVYKPVVGRFKVYMIDEVHMLTNTAFNAMLKTLEEPPEYLKFVLATTDPQKVPVTVLSRCLQFNLRPMPQQTVFEHLQTVLSAENVPFEGPALALLARAARGSMRDGLSLTDQAIAFGGGAVNEAPVRAMLGSVDRVHVRALLDAVVARDGRALVDGVDHLRQLGLSAQGTLDDLASALQDAAVLQAVPELAETDAERAVWRDLSRQLAPDECQLFYNLALHGRAELALAPDEYAGLLMILLRWLAFRPAASQGDADPKARGPEAEQPAGPDRSPVTVTSAVSSAVTSPRPAVTMPREPAPAPAPAQPQAVPAAEPVPMSAPSRPTTPAAALSEAASPAAPRDDGPPPWDDVPPADDDAASTPAEPDWLMAEERADSGQIDVAGRRMASPGPRAVADPVSAPAAPGSTAVAVSDVPVADPEAGWTPLGERWADVVSRLQAEGLVNALVRELAMQGECVAVEESGERSTWHLRVERETLRAETQRERLQTALRRLLGEHTHLIVEAGVPRDTPALREQAARARRQQAAEALITTDPLVRQLLQSYPGARVVAGSISAIAPPAVASRA